MEPMSSTNVRHQIHALACTEVVVQHGDGSWECAGGRCEVDLRVHRFVVACTEVECHECEGAAAAA